MWLLVTHRMMTTLMRGLCLTGGPSVLCNQLRRTHASSKVTFAPSTVASRMNQQPVTDRVMAPPATAIPPPPHPTYRIEAVRSCPRRNTTSCTLPHPVLWPHPLRSSLPLWRRTPPGLETSPRWPRAPIHTQSLSTGESHAHLCSHTCAPTQSACRHAGHSHAARQGAFLDSQLAAQLMALDAQLHRRTACWPGRRWLTWSCCKWTRSCG